MKLLDKYNRISLFTTVLVIIITGIIYYFTVSFILTSQVDQDLLVEENEIFDYVKLNHHLPQVFKSENLKIRFEPVGKGTVTRQLINVKFWNEREGEQESGRELISSVAVNGTNYRITIIESKVETEYLIRVIFLITLGIILVLILVLVLINRLVIRNLWRPFYDLLNQIKLFNLTDSDSITALNTSIDEFKDLNQEVTAMSLRVRQDYQELKNFVENASHELMTPIAVMNSKLDTLVQDSTLTDRQGVLIGEVYQMVTRMKNLNKAMLILSRIENRLITQQEEIDLSDRVKQVLCNFQELLMVKEIKLTTGIHYAQIMMNRDLLDILLNNLLSNAIRHNYKGGEIEVTLQQGELSFANTGYAATLDADIIFQRFQKSAESEGTGLGLTLAHEICESYGFKLSYTYLAGKHHFMVGF